MCPHMYPLCTHVWHTCRPLYFMHEVAVLISRSLQYGWWGLVLAEMHPGWLCITCRLAILFREMWFIDCSCSHAHTHTHTHTHTHIQPGIWQLVSWKEEKERRSKLTADLPTEKLESEWYKIAHWQYEVINILLYCHWPLDLPTSLRMLLSLMSLSCWRCFLLWTTRPSPKRSLFHSCEPDHLGRSIW